MKEFDFDNAFGQPPAEFGEGMARALAQVKEEKSVKKFSMRTLALAAVLVLALCGIALAVSYTQGVEWFLTERYLDPPTLPENFKEQVQSDILQENTGDFLNVVIQDAVWIHDIDESYPNSFQLTLNAVLKDTEKYEMHEELSLNTDGDTSERNDEDWLWTEKGHGPIPEMMTDPKKQLVFFDSGKFTIGTPDGFAMPGYGEDSFLAENGSVLCYMTINLNQLDPDWVKTTYDYEKIKASFTPDEGKKLLEDKLANTQAYQEAKAKHTDESGLTALVFHYAAWEYPGRQTNRHEGYVTFKAKLP